MIHPIVNEMTVQNVLFLVCHPKEMEKKKPESIVFNLGACSEIGLSKTISELCDCARILHALKSAMNQILRQEIESYSISNRNYPQPGTKSVPLRSEMIMFWVFNMPLSNYVNLEK